MIVLLSIVVPVIIFLIVLWAVAVIQKHWIKDERRANGNAVKPRRQDRSTYVICEVCGASGPGVLFINRVCLDCYEKARHEESSLPGDDPDLTEDDMARYYRIVGCARTDSDEKIRRQYHKRAKEVHPDAMQRDDLTEEAVRLRTAEFRQLQEAYDKILEQRARRR